MSLFGKYVVYRRVRAGCRSEQIVALVKHVSAGTVQSRRVPACKVSGWYGNLYSFRLASLYAYLFGVKEVNRRLFNLVVYIVLSIRSVYVELSKEITVFRTVVCNPDRCSRFTVFGKVDLNVKYFLRVGNIGKALTESKYYFVRVIPRFTGRRTGSRFSIIRSVYYGIVVAGLVIFVTYVNAFRFYYIIVGKVGYIAGSSKKVAPCGNRIKV